MKVVRTDTGYIKCPCTETNIYDYICSLLCKYLDGEECTFDSCNGCKFKEAKKYGKK